MQALRLLAAVSVIGVSLAAAAVAQQTTQPVQPPAVQTVPRITVNPNVAAPPTYAQLQQQNQTLAAQLAAERERIAALQQQNNRLTQQNRTLQQQIAQLTSRGGSLVRAYCVNDTTSRNTAGVQASCGSYQCEPVSGLCRTQCDRTTDCALGSVCDPDRRMCLDASRF